MNLSELERLHDEDCIALADRLARASKELLKLRGMPPTQGRCNPLKSRPGAHPASDCFQCPKFGSMIPGPSMTLGRGHLRWVG